MVVLRQRCYFFRLEALPHCMHVYLMPLLVLDMMVQHYEGICSFLLHADIDTMEKRTAIMLRCFFVLLRLYLKKENQKLCYLVTRYRIQLAFKIWVSSVIII